MISTFYLPGRVCSTKAIREIAEKASAAYTMICLKPEIEWVYLGQERMIQVLEMTGATMVYADHFAKIGDTVTQAPVIDYQIGALRDDFDFGAVLLWDTAKLKAIVAQMDTEYEFAGLYDLRLRATDRMAQTGGEPLAHIPEYLYYEVETDTRKSGEKLFDYVDPRNRQVQIEMEACVTAHLKRIGAYLKPGAYKELPVTDNPSPVTASVIIPCKNRARTIADAIHSALNQKVRAGYSFNVIVVDDNSTDGTAEIVEEILQAKPVLQCNGLTAERSNSASGLVLITPLGMRSVVTGTSPSMTRVAASMLSNSTLTIPISTRPPCRSSLTPLKAATTAW